MVADAVASNQPCGLSPSCTPSDGPRLRRSWACLTLPREGRTLGKPGRERSWQELPYGKIHAHEAIRDEFSSKCPEWRVLGVGLHRPISDEYTTVEAGDVHLDETPLVKSRKTNVDPLVKSCFLNFASLKNRTVAWI